MIKTRERDDCLEWLSDFDNVILYADFEHEKVGTNLADSYYDITFAMDEFLEFADRIREKLNEQKGRKMTQQEAYDELMEELGRMKPIRGKLKFITKDGIFEMDTNFFPARVRKIEPKEQDG